MRFDAENPKTSFAALGPREAQDRAVKDQIHNDVKGCRDEWERHQSTFYEFAHVALLIFVSIAASILTGHIKDNIAIKRAAAGLWFVLVALVVLYVSSLYGRRRLYGLSMYLHCLVECGAGKVVGILLFVGLSATVIAFVFVH